MERVSENPAPGSSPRQGQTTQSRIPLAHSSKIAHPFLMLTKLKFWAHQTIGHQINFIVWKNNLEFDRFSFLIHAEQDRVTKRVYCVSTETSKHVLSNEMKNHVLLCVWALLCAY